VRRGGGFYFQHRFSICRFENLRSTPILASIFGPGMKNTRTFRTLARSLLGAALTSASAFAISPDDLSALRAKAETGDGIAQHNLGLVYANSQEAVSDLVEAYAWLNLAADNGATGRSLMIVTRQMTPEQIADGKRRFEQIRDAIAAKKPIPAGASVAATRSFSPVSPVSDSPVSSSPIRAAEAEAREAELKKISAELADAWKENDQLKTAVAKAEKDATAAAAALKAEKDRLAASLNDANREIAGMKAAAANFEGERNGLLQKIDEAKKASEGELRLKVVALETDLAKAGLVSKELDAAKQSLASMGAQQQKLTAENQRLDGLVKQAETNVAGKAAEAEKGLAALRAELAALQTQQADAAKKIAAGEKTAADLAAAQTRIRTLESDAAKFAAEKNDLNGKLAAAAASAVSATEVARVNSQLTELKDRLSSSQQALAVANADVASLKQELQGAKSGVVPIQQHRELQAKLEGAAAEQQKRAQEELKKVQDAAAAEKARLTAELASATAASTDEIGALKAGAANFEGERNGLLKKIADTEQALVAATAESGALKEQIAALKRDTVPAQQVKALEAQLADATKARAEQEKAREELQKSVAALEAEKAGIAEKLTALTDASTREAAALKAGAANFEGERNGLLKKIAEAGDSLARVTAEAAAAKEKLALAQATARDAEQTAADLARVNQELDAAKKAAGVSQKSLADARSEAADLKKQLADSKAKVVPARQHQELQGKFDALTKAQEEQQAAQTELQKKVAALVAERSELSGKLSAQSDAARGEAAGLKAAAANFEGERNGLLQKITEAEQALVRATAESDGLKERLAAAAKAGEAPAQQVEELRAQLTAAARAQEAQQRQQEALKETNAALEAEGARLARELAAAQAASGDVARATSAMEALQAKLKAAEDAATAARADREAMGLRVAVLEQQALAPKGEDPAELRKELDAAAERNAALIGLSRIKQEELDELQKSLTATDSERAALAGRIAAAEKLAAEANAASQAGREASAQLASMREQLRNAQNQVGQLAAENIQLKNRPAGDVAGGAGAPLVLSAPRRPAATSSPTSTPVRASQVAEARIHTVAEGETLTRIARRYYGSSERWAEIYDANRASLPNPAALTIGMKLRIP
jgi:chromosome segregation ATPase